MVFIAVCLLMLAAYTDAYGQYTEGVGGIYNEGGSRRVHFSHSIIGGHLVGNTEGRGAGQFEGGGHGHVVVGSHIHHGFVHGHSVIHHAVPATAVHTVHHHHHQVAASPVQPQVIVVSERSRRRQSGRRFRFRGSGSSSSSSQRRHRRRRSRHHGSDSG